MLSFGEGIAVLVLLGGIVGVWIHAKTDIAKIQVQIADIKEALINKAASNEVAGMKADICEVKTDIKELLQRTAK